MNCCVSFKVRLRRMFSTGFPLLREWYGDMYQQLHAIGVCRTLIMRVWGKQGDKARGRI